jgi:light-harvesting protein B-800-850 alpha chain
MNNAKMWLVVKPTVGIPLFLSAVAIGSFAVHVAVLSKTNWYNDYLVGKLGQSAALQIDEEATAKVAFRPEVGQEVLIRMPDGTVAKAVLQPLQAEGSLN